MIKHIVTSLFDNYSRLSKKIENSNFLIESSWVMFNEDSTKKSLFIFSPNNILTVSINGKVEKSITSWNLLNADTIMLTIDDESFIYKKFFLDNNFLVFQKDNSKEKIVLVNETNFKNKIFFSLEDIKEHLYNTYEKPKIIQAEKQKKINQTIDKAENVVTQFGKIISFLGILFFLQFIPTGIFVITSWDTYHIAMDPEGYKIIEIVRTYIIPILYLTTIPTAYFITKKILN
jgi:hypothetical protein